MGSQKDLIESRFMRSDRFYILDVRKDTVLDKLATYITYKPKHTQHLIKIR